ncbi:MAG: type II toxin-antitoxin system RelE/ParE family toxin [Woeseiaceae bacterium]
MIKTFKHKGLKELFEKGVTRKIHPNQHRKCTQQLDAIDSAEIAEDLNIIGWRFHQLTGFKQRYSLTVTANFRITFDFKDGEAFIVDYLDYH